MYKALYYLPHVLKNQYLKPENLKKLQEKRLRNLVQHAYRNTRFYKEKFRKAGITPHDIHGLDELEKIPFTTKEEVVKGANIAAGYHEGNCDVHFTSGTSGTTLKVLYDIENHAYEIALTCRYHWAQGVRPWHNYFMILHDPVELKGAQKRSIFHKRMSIPGDIPDEEKVELARKYRPQVIAGHLSTLVAMAKIVQEKKISIAPKIIIIGGELNPPPYRQYVETVFGGQTFDKYGAFETKSIAWECNQHNMHIDADSVIVECVKGGEVVTAQERGEVVVTSLWNWAMPFIRYRLGDSGVLSDEVCGCGRTLPLMKVIEGRIDDFIVLPSGNVLPPTALVPLFFKTQEIEQFRIIQNRKDLLEVEIMPNKDYTGVVEKTILEKLEKIINEPIHIQIKKVETINQKVKTKYRTVISNVKMDISSLGG